MFLPITFLHIFFLNTWIPKELKKWGLKKLTIFAWLSPYLTGLFWRRGQNAYFDVAVTNAGAVSYAGKPLKSVLAKFERAKKSKYNHRVMNIEHGTFTPLIFTANGCMGPECSMFHKSIADKISEKTGEAYSDVISFIRCKLSFILMRSAILCARGSRRPKNSDNLATIGDDFGLYAKVLNIRE